MRILYSIVQYVREVLGDDRYERYCRHLRSTGREAAIPTRERFYLESLERRYKGVSRCC